MKIVKKKVKNHKRVLIFLKQNNVFALILWWNDRHGLNVKCLFYLTLFTVVIYNETNSNCPPLDANYST